MTNARRRLPNRRRSENLNFICNDLGYTCTFSRPSTGEIGELFLNNHRVNSHADVNARDVAVLCFSPPTQRTNQHTPQSVDA